MRTLKRRAGALQIPVIRKGFMPHQQREIVFATGIRCPRCQIREIVYNGNYYCDGLTRENSTCEWALPHTDDTPECVPPAYLDLFDALMKSIPKREPL